MMPEEYKSGITYHIPKGRSMTIREEGLTSTRWTKEEEEWCWTLHKNGYKYKDIAKSVDRPLNSVRLKMKRLKKKHNEYNSKHIEDINTFGNIMAEILYYENQFLEELQNDKSQVIYSVVISYIVLFVILYLFKYEYLENIINKKQKVKNP
jgi:hypothetical protein